MLASPSRYAGDDKYDPEEVALMKVCLTVSHGRIPMHNTLAFGRDALAGSRRFPNPPPPRLTPPRNRIASALSTTSLAATSSPLPGSQAVPEGSWDAALLGELADPNVPGKQADPTVPGKQADPTVPGKQADPTVPDVIPEGTPEVTATVPPATPPLPSPIDITPKVLRPLPPIPRPTAPTHAPAPPPPPPPPLPPPPPHRHRPPSLLPS